MITFILLVTAIELNFTQMTLRTLRAAWFVVVIWQARIQGVVERTHTQRVI